MNNTKAVDDAGRRMLVGALASAGLVGALSVTGADVAGSATARAPAGARVPQLDFVYECDATLSEVQSFGQTIEGQRRIIPITGGTFTGPSLRGRVLSGGADWNLVRSDGASSVEAAYYLQTDDGIILRVVNKGIGKAAPAGDSKSAEKFFMFTAPVIEAPIGKYDWMNHTVFVATLGARSGTTNAVLIRVFRLV